MAEADSSDDKRTQRATAALVIGTIALAAASLATGTVAIAALGVFGGTLVSFGLCTACGGKGESKTPCCWPEDDGVTESSASTPTPTVSLDTPHLSDRWRELAARSASAARGR